METHRLFADHVTLGTSNARSRSTKASMSGTQPVMARALCGNCPLKLDPL